MATNDRDAATSARQLPAGTLTVLAIALMALLLAGCDSGPSEAEKAVQSVIDNSGDAARALDTLATVSWSRHQAELAFVSDRGGNSDIYLTRGADTTWTNLTRSEENDGWPVWSPDGTRIAFQRAVRVEGEPERNDTHLDIFVMNADGSAVERLTDHPADDYRPSWSHDGTRIAFTSWRQESRDSVLVKRRLPRAKNHVYIMNADGSDQRRMFDESPGQSVGVSWASDGEAMLFARKEGKDGAVVSLASPAGFVIRPLSGAEAMHGAPVFSPDNRRVAFHADYGDRSEIVVVDRWGLGREIVVAEGKNWNPCWSPDGRWLVYTSVDPDGNSDIRAVSANGGDPVMLAAGPDREAEASWRPVR